MTNKCFQDLAFHGVRALKIESWTPDLSDESRGELAFDFLERFTGQNHCNIKEVSFEGCSEGLVVDMMERIKALGSVESICVSRSEQYEISLDNIHRMKEIDRCFASRGGRWTQLRALDLLAISRYAWLRNVEPDALGT